MEMVEEGKDRMSELSDWLLLEILSRLPSTKEAIKTATLSKRWKHIWTLLPTPIFKYYPPWSAFVSFVDKTLNQSRQLKLKKFEVHASYDVRIKSQVNDWIHYAISRDVEELILGLWNIESEVEAVLDQIFFTSSCFTHLTLSGCLMNPTGGISWKNLRNLCMSRLKTEEDLIRIILSGSPLLETFVLDYCHGYKRLDITSKSVKNLVISGYMDTYSVNGDNIIEINAPNISSLTIKDELVLWKILLVNTSSLVEANLDYIINGHWEMRFKEAEEEMLKGLILNLSHVKVLKIGTYCFEAMSHLEAKGFVFPTNVKFPVVIPHWHDVVSN